MDFKKLFPLVDFNNNYTFEKCQTLQDFLVECVSIYFLESVKPKNLIDDRVKESCLSVYMAFRDHYPVYLKYLDHQKIEKLNSEIILANPKIIKLRRIVIGALAKVA